MCEYLLTPLNTANRYPPTISPAANCFIQPLNPFPPKKSTSKEPSTQLAFPHGIRNLTHPQLRKGNNELHKGNRRHHYNTPW